MVSKSKLRCKEEGGACLQRCLAGTLQHFEDLVLGRLPNALDEGQEAARSRGFGQARWLQLLLFSLPMFKKLRGRKQRRRDQETDHLHLITRVEKYSVPVC